MIINPSGTIVNDGAVIVEFNLALDNVSLSRAKLYNPAKYIVAPPLYTNVAPTSGVNNTYIWDNLYGGVYLLSYTINECTHTEIINVEAKECELELDIAITHCSSLTANDGSFAIGILGGNLPTVTQVTFPDNSTNHTINAYRNLTIGSYIIKVTDAIGCWIQKVISITTVDTSIQQSAATNPSGGATVNLTISNDANNSNTNTSTCGDGNTVEICCSDHDCDDDTISCHIPTFTLEEEEEPPVTCHIPTFTCDDLTPTCHIPTCTICSTNPGILEFTVKDFGAVIYGDPSQLIPTCEIGGVGDIEVQIYSALGFPIDMSPQPYCTGDCESASYPVYSHQATDLLDFMTQYVNAAAVGILAPEGAVITEIDANTIHVKMYIELTGASPFTCDTPHLTMCSMYSGRRAISPTFSGPFSVEGTFTCCNNVAIIHTKNICNSVNCFTGCNNSLSNACCASLDATVMPPTNPTQYICNP